MRLLLTFLAALLSVALFVAGVLFVLIGIVEQRDAEATYVVGFIPGADCDDGHELYLRVEDGTVMSCGPGYAASMSRRFLLPGITDAQSSELNLLIAGLGTNGLSVGEQGEIQRRVDALAATVPAAKRPYADHAVWGANRAWLGGAMVVAGVLGGFAVGRLTSSPGRPSEVTPTSRPMT